MIDPNKVRFEDDFLGYYMKPEWKMPVGSNVPMITGHEYTAGGAVMLWTGCTINGDGTRTPLNAFGNCKLHFGEDFAASQEPTFGKLNSRNWLPQKSFTFETCVRFNANTALQCTIGFVGPHDPENYLCFRCALSDNSSWIAHMRANAGAGINQSLNWMHTPNVWHTLRLITNWVPTPSAAFYVDDDLKAQITDPSYFPDKPMIFEFNFWNEFVNGQWSSRQLFADYVLIEQDR